MYYLKVQISPNVWETVDSTGSSDYSIVEGIKKKLIRDYKGELKPTDFRIVKK